MVNKECQTVDKKQSQIVQACTGLFSVFVSKAIAETIQGIVKFSECVGIPPYLKLYVDFKENLVLKPTSQEVTELFWQSIDELILTADELRVLGKQRIKGCGIKSIVLCLTEEFVSKCKQDIACNIEGLYKPIVNYLNQITKDFAEIYSDVNCEEFVQVLGDIEFEVGCQQIAYYKKYIHKVAYIPDNEYFQIGQLVLKNYRDKLKDSLQSITDSIFNNLSLQHLREVQDICDSFQLIKTKAYQKPSTTDELIEIGKFMTWVKNEQLQDLNQRVHASLAYLCKIITLGLLSKDHMNLNAEAITWLDEIGPIVDQHAVNYDQLKFEAEEKLQKVIEEINVDIQEVYPLLVVLDEMDDIKYARKYLSDITLHMTKIKQIQLKIEWINKEEVCLSFPKSTYAEFDNLKDYVYPFYHLLRLCQHVQRHVSVWLDGQFDVLDYEITNERVEHFCRDLGDLQKDYRKKLRQAQDENLPIRFKGTVDDPDILNWPAPLKLCITALKIMEDFKPSLKVMQIMCNDSLRPRHWKAMSEIAGFNITPNAGTTLRKMMQIDLKDKLYEYEIISTGATKEQELLDNLNNLKADWNNVKFVTSKYKNKLLILDHLQDVRTIIDDHMIKVLKMRSSVFVKAHATEVTDFYDVLLNVETVFDNWDVIQQDYLKLLPIFSISDVNQLVPKEKNLFEKCSAIFNSYIQKILKNPIIINLISQTQMVKDLNNCLNKMEQVKHGVNTYLEVTRQHFPRLYFLSNSELVELISKNGDFTEKDFLIKLFPGIEKVKYNSDKEICGVVSPLGEELNIRNSFNPVLEDGLHKILKKLEEETKKTLQHLTAECCKVFKKTKIKDLVMKYPQQSVQLAAQVFWTDQVENALKLPHNIKLLLYKKRLEGYIDEKVNIIKSTNLSNMERTIFKNLLLTDLKHKYLLAYFLKTGLVIDDNHFDWQVQLRYYFQKNFLTVRVLDNSVSYGYEYYGNNSQAILTPSVEKCNKTLLNAYFSNFLGLVAGKSGTGKSKTVSSLAESLGLLHFEFLCTNSLEMETLLQLLKGAVSCGAWLILDSFDKLKQEIFSVFTQELLSVLETKKQNKTNVLLENMYVGLNPRCFVCALTEVRSHISLPENLKVLFRIFTLPKPDLSILTETFLTSQGMKDSKNCSRKLVKCLEYFQDAMSYQKQYKFELKVVMNVLGTFEYEKTMQSSDGDEKVLCDSIRKVLYTCLVQEDVKIFNGILENVFHEKYCIEGSSSQAVRDIESVWGSICEEYNLEINNEFKNKSIELYNALTSKTNIMIVGDVFAAKTTCLKVCTRVFEKTYNKSIKTHYINPKCVNYTDLYGNLENTENSTWTDGILLKILRENQEDQKNKTNLIVFDGHIDQTWTENIRGVLENKKLFLESGEVLMFSDNNKFIYETINLADCDPFMVSFF
ncbi:dynein heavy chain 12, axonemal-like [Sitophilus oryzae]|uniref:Dynein heavy chain 12, axonemal-like n=1 Tax=Sitophilus oryzae TaxID=7048 RepID=A0A6J2XFE3_SITOR|nr:dynein heavy chain 12, axonemal-like [Sitophilus oryzae]